MRMRVEKAILLVSDGKCFYCKEKATQADHIVPVRKGGSDEPDNFVPSCQPCNTRKRANLLPAHVEPFALACARNLAKMIAERGIDTYGRRAGFTLVRFALDPELKQGIDAWFKNQPMDPDYIGAFRYAMRRVLLEDGFLGRTEQRQETAK